MLICYLIEPHTVGFSRWKQMAQIRGKLFQFPIIQRNLQEKMNYDIIKRSSW